MRVRLSFGSTGNFARQIREGAPFQIFMAADERFIADLHADGFTPDEGDLYAVGRIVILVPNGSTLTAGREPRQPGRDAGRGADHPLCHRQPRARALRDACARSPDYQGPLGRLQPVIVLGENVSQAAQFALSGNAEGGIIAYSLALAPEVAPRGAYALIPEDWHTPLRQRMALLNSAGPVAAAFYAYMMEPAAREIMERYGFVLPEGD